MLLVLIKIIFRQLSVYLSIFVLLMIKVLPHLPHKNVQSAGERKNSNTDFSVNQPPNHVIDVTIISLI